MTTYNNVLFQPDRGWHQGREGLDSVMACYVLQLGGLGFVRTKTLKAFPEALTAKSSARSAEPRQVLTAMRLVRARRDTPPPLLIQVDMLGDTAVVRAGFRCVGMFAIAVATIRAERGCAARCPAWPRYLVP
jgi:hypothetical protein